MKTNTSNVPIVFTLADGTVVTLAPQGVLHYPALFDQKERVVMLDGEAQFHVKRDVAHPFKVHSGDLVATVLGTVFKIKQQDGDSVTQVELLSGKLQVETELKDASGIQSVILNPEERILYNRYNRQLIKETWQRNAGTVITAPHIEFRKENFESIAKQIKAVYGVTVINNSPQKDWMFTGSFNNSTAKELIENICIIKKLKYQVQGDTFYIK